MPWGPLGVTAVLAALDWGAWEWAITANDPTIGLIAGLVMAPIAVAFAWSLARVLVALAQVALRWATPAARADDRRLEGGSAGVRGPRVPFDIEGEDGRGAGDERVAA
jgi:hypothetical protein